MLQRFFVAFAPAFCAVSAFANPATAKEWFVAPGANGNGDSATPFGSIQAGIDAAQPGDIVTVAAGTYAESLHTARDGTAAAPITVRAASNGEVIVNLAAELLQVDHAYFVLEGVVLDAEYANEDIVDANDGASGLVLRNVEIRRATKDCIDMGGPADVLIEGCHIHRCLNAAGGQTDAHGITGGPVKNLVIRNTEIHTFSGDAIQFDPGRSLPGWSDILVDGCKLWTGPLESAENGFAAGTVTGENAIDTKTNPAAPRATLSVVNTSVWGFRGGLIGNMAAFNMKENIDARFDRVTVFDSEIAFRTRGPGANGGAWVHVQNAVVFDVDKAVRYEDDIEQLVILNTTFGQDVLAPFEEASSPATTPDVQNLLLLGTSLPSEAAAASNLAVDASSFVDASASDYHLVASSPAVDSGETIATVSVDRDGTTRPQGAGYDIGAYEQCTGSECGGSGGSSGSGATSSGSGGTSGASSGGSSNADGESDDDGGCGCRTAPATPHAAWLGVLALIGLSLRRRRRE